MAIALSARFKYIYTKVAGLGVLHVRRNVVATRQCAVMGARLGAIVLGAAREQRAIINNLYMYIVDRRLCLPRHGVVLLLLLHCLGSHVQ